MRAGIPKMRSRLVRLPSCSAVLPVPENALQGVTLGPNRTGSVGFNFCLWRMLMRPQLNPLCPDLAPPAAEVAPGATVTAGRDDDQDGP